MKLQQLRCITAMTRHRLNVSATADALFTSQPGVSRQIRMLEEELGVDIFERSGRQVTKVTPAGEAIIELAEDILRKVQDIRTVSSEHADPESGELTIATTHTQARYILPRFIVEFSKRYPRVNLQLQQGTPMQIATMAARGEVHLAIATEALELFDDLTMLPAYHWNRAILVPVDHPLAKRAEEGPLQLSDIADWPIITYVFGFTGRSELDRAFHDHGLTPNVVLTAADADVIKTYVRMGQGIGIIARMAFEPEMDRDLVALDAAHLFKHSTTCIGLRRDCRLRDYSYDFIHSFAPHLNREIIDKALVCDSPSDCVALLDELELPML